MKRIIIVMALMFAMASVASAVEFTALRWTDEGHQFSLGVGVASYSELQRGEGEDEGMAIYVQTPIVSWEYAQIGLGGTFPLEYLDRSRPHFSLDFILMQSGSLQLEIGPYIMASPYLGWGVHSGLSFRF